ncbi:Nonspecific acid phosphatase [Nostocoides japonicum T1-X7]|uniref:Nonspecific acid phosphatase n=1 Tax=Nostocoides japonicum T1-X7 TaxID=1194083 RepID=A0A077LUD8_9MICO|nr:HAD family hydrolase [Tetrasphaera japonica]CCH77418.1 Nonspecific acid phosphatase [Tetrasphaera japonica T1-X7]
MSRILPSWRPGRTREAIVAFLEAAGSLPVEDRVAFFDNDGTLWCERPRYVQLDFFLDTLRSRVTADPGLRDRPEFAALLDGDAGQVAALGLPRIALALASLFEGMSPEEFAAAARAFLRGAVSGRYRPASTLVYQPMLELIAQLRRLDFTVGIVTGGGADFLRAVSQELYGVPPELVVGSLIEYDVTTDARGATQLRRTARLLGAANEGPAKVSNIQAQLGRRPLLAAGNSAGDLEMLQWAASGPGPGLALLVDHDDAEREHAYESRAETVANAEPIAEVAARSGWTVVSMATDWESVFPSSPAG